MAGDHERRYTEEEFALILRRAMDRQDLPALPAPAADGLALREIQAIAREVGVDPEAVVRAAALMPAAPPAPNRLLGGPEQFQFEYVADGQLAPERFGVALDAIRGAAGAPGRTEEKFGGFEWRTEGELTQVSVTVTPGDGRTRVRVLADRRAAAALTMLSTLLPAAVATGIIGAVLEPTGVPAIAGLVTATFGSGLLAARLLWVRATRRLAQRLRRLVGAANQAVDDGISG